MVSPHAPKTEKWCYSCQSLLPIIAFNRNRTSLDGYQTMCKDCCRRYKAKNYERIKAQRREYEARDRELILARARLYQRGHTEQLKKKNKEYHQKTWVPGKGWPTNLWKRYGLRVEDYERMYAEQVGLCAICRKPSSHPKRMAVDHDHETGQVRGLLCVKCNFLLGVADDETSRLMSAVEYLKKWRTLEN